MVRTGTDRQNKYAAKQDGEITGRRFTAQKTGMAGQQQVYFANIGGAEQKAKRTLESAGENAIHIPIYLLFVRELFKLSSRFEMTTRRQEAFRLLEKWRSRGMNPDRLTEIMAGFGLDPRCYFDVDYFDSAIYG